MQDKIPSSGLDSCLVKLYSSKLKEYPQRLAGSELERPYTKQPTLGHMVILLMFDVG